MTKRALISLTDKSGVVEFACSLVEMGFEILSTGGTAGALRQAKLPVRDVSELTGFPEILGGRLKTLHPLVHGGLLGDLRLGEHRKEMDAAGIASISLLCVNLYDFETRGPGADLAGAIEAIDIGGPAMIRAAAKNHANVLVVVEPADYSAVAGALRENQVTDEMRLRLAAKAFRHTAFYDSLVSRVLTERSGESLLDAEKLTVGLRRAQRFRYGENPHQQGALYVDPLGGGGVANAKQLWGKELSYNNVLDADSAWELVSDLPVGACAIIKHGNPCGAAVGRSLGESYSLARQSDPISAFGGIAAFHGAVDQSAAEAMAEKGNFLEVVIGTGYTSEALSVLQGRSGWGQDVRLLEAPLPPRSARLSVRSVGGGAVVQEVDEDPGSEWTTATKRPPSSQEQEGLRFLWSVVQHVKSNAIVVGTRHRLLGVGAGQMNRVQSVRLALEQAGEGAKGACLASDAFFPFPDSIQTAASAGISAIVQPGGSKKDSEVIAAADALGIAMVLTGVRHFRH